MTGWLLFTSKFTSKSKVWNNFCVGYSIRKLSAHLSPDLYSGRAKGQVWGILLTIINDQFRSSRRDLRNGTVQFAIWQTCLDRSDRFKGEVWPVLPRLSRKPSSCQFWVSTYAPLFLGKACVPRNISPSPKIHLNNEKHLRTNHVLLWRMISYIGHVILYKRDKPEYIQPRLWIMFFKGTASVHLVK